MAHICAMLTAMSRSFPPHPAPSVTSVMPATPRRRRGAKLIPAQGSASAAPLPIAASLPSWVQAGQPVESSADAAFLAGAALHALDVLVRSEPVWAGAWRQRLALKAATASMRLAGRTEDENALRDAWYLRRAGDAAGPAGRILGAWRVLASRHNAPLSPSRGPASGRDGMAVAAEEFGLSPDPAFAELSAAVDALVASPRPAPFVAAAVASHVGAARPDGEMLAWWCADFALARKLGWPRPVPLLMARAETPAFRLESGRSARLRPGQGTMEGEGSRRPFEQAPFEQALCLALAEGAAEALRLAAVISRRADRLLVVAPKLRSKGAADVVQRLLDDDAVPGTLTTETLSRFGARRCFLRLQDLEAVRELSGRAAFRLYGL